MNKPLHLINPYQTAKLMLTESDVIFAVCEFLKKHGCEIKRTCTENQRGDDIVAFCQKNNRELVIEAKGQTSSKKGSKRYGKEFNGSQVNDHVSKAFFRSAKEIGGDKLSAMALPKTKSHVDNVDNIREALKVLKIEVFWVSLHETVEVEGIWDFWGNDVILRNDPAHSGAG